MDQQLKEAMADSVREFKLPEYREIPNVGLYLEQVTKYVTEYTQPLAGINITGSMISNYVKQKLIANPIKKMYYREQIAYVLFVAIAKSVLALEDIKHLIELQQECSSTQDAYEYFCIVMEYRVKDVFELESDYNSDEETRKVISEIDTRTMSETTSLDECGEGSDNKSTENGDKRDEKLLLNKLIVAIVNKIYMETYFRAR